METNSFPLYDELALLALKEKEKVLSAQNSQTKGKKEEKEKLCMDLCNIPKDSIELELLYVLILHHYLTIEKGSPKKLPPYESKIMNPQTNRGIQMFLSNLPSELILILKQYAQQIKKN